MLEEDITQWPVQVRDRTNARELRRPSRGGRKLANLLKTAKWRAFLRQISENLYVIFIAQIQIDLMAILSMPLSLAL